MCVKHWNKLQISFAYAKLNSKTNQKMNMVTHVYK